jgi:hypothetical protein
MLRTAFPFTHNESYPTEKVSSAKVEVILDVPLNTIRREKK